MCVESNLQIVYQYYVQSSASIDLQLNPTKLNQDLTHSQKKGLQDTRYVSERLY